MYLPPDYSPTVEDYEKWIRVEVWDGEEKLAEDSIWFSKLPVLYINTDDGEPVTSKIEYKPAVMKVQNNGICPETECKGDGQLEIKGRGNSTWGWPKKPYKIKLASKTDMFGMGENKHWVLLANYLDECMMRSATAFRISEQLGMLTMEYIWVDVVLNDFYIGNYQLCEHIRIGEGRVDIADWEEIAEEIAKAVYDREKAMFSKEDKTMLKDTLKGDLSWVTSGEFIYGEKVYTVSDYYEMGRNDISGGYLFELSMEYDEISKFTTENGLQVMVSSPKYLNTNPNMMEYAINYWQNFENAIQSENGYVDINGFGWHYSLLADMDTMVSYWLVMEIMGNGDAVWKSRYAYKDKGALLKFGPVWDFDYWCDSILAPIEPDSWIVVENPWDTNFFKEFTDDPLFLCKATEKYWEIHELLLALVDDDGILDGWYEYLYEVAMADQECWPNRNWRGFIKDYDVFKKFLQDRIEWLDQQFATDAILLKSLDFKHSASPYVKSDDMLGMAVLNGRKDITTLHAPADFITCGLDNLHIVLQVNDMATTEVELYVNGFYNGKISVPEGGRINDISIYRGCLAEPAGKKNVISLIGKDAEGNTTYRNFMTVIKTGGGHADSDGDGQCDICHSEIEIEVDEPVTEDTVPGDDMVELEQPVQIVEETNKEETNKEIVTEEDFIMRILSFLMLAVPGMISLLISGRYKYSKMEDGTKEKMLPNLSWVLWYFAYEFVVVMLAYGVIYFIKGSVTLSLGIDGAGDCNYSIYHTNVVFLYMLAAFGIAVCLGIVDRFWERGFVRKK